MKLWINGSASHVDAVLSIKLVAVVTNGQKPEITAKLWARVVAERYANEHTQDLIDAFLRCEAGKSWPLSDGLSATVRCHRGPKATEHSLIFQ